MKKKNLSKEKKEQLWQELIRLEIKKRQKIFLLLALCSLLVAVIAIILEGYAIAMAAIIAFMINIILWGGNIFIIKFFYNQGEYGFVSLILNYHFSDTVWERKKLKKLRRKLAYSVKKEERKQIKKKITLLKIWINQVK